MDEITMLKAKIERLHQYIDCINPKHCGCDRCPNCEIFYEKLQEEFVSQDESQTGGKR